MIEKMEIILSTFGSIISTDDTSKKIKDAIKNGLNNNGTVEVNASGVVISTKSARLIFGHLFRELSKLHFNEKISFKNASPSFMFAINEGIVTELNS